MAANPETIKPILEELVAHAISKFKQDLMASNDEEVEKAIRKFRKIVTHRSWKSAQKWCKWSDEGPVLMPDFTRIYYRKGKTEILVQEFSPQIRLTKLMGSLACRGSSTDKLSTEEMETVHSFSLAMPYVIFIFKFVGGVFREVKCAFSDRPLKRLDERPLRPYFSNIDTTLKVCLGASFDSSNLIEGDIVQQASYVLSYYWQSVYRDEWSTHYWDNKRHFETVDSRLSTPQEWQKASLENPLFVVEDVNWLKHNEETFGEIIMKMVEDDKTNWEYSEELFKDLADNFEEEVKKQYNKEVGEVESKSVKIDLDEITNRIIEAIK